MSLQLNKPLVFFDIEATGLNIVQDRIIEISLLKLFPNEEKEMKTWRVNPEMTIPEEVTLIHGIRDEDVAEQPPFKNIAKDLIRFIDNSDLSGYNLLRFDLPMLMEEFLRCDLNFDISKRKIVDVQRIFHQKEKRDLASAYKFYCEKDLFDAHSAEADTRATAEILIAQVKKYEDLNGSVDFLDEYTGSPGMKMIDLAGRIVKNDKDVPCFNFGKYRNRPVNEVLEKDPSYYNWIMNGDFPAYTKKKLTELRLMMMTNNK